MSLSANATDTAARSNSCSPPIFEFKMAVVALVAVAVLPPLLPQRCGWGVKHIAGETFHHRPNIT